MSKMPPSSQNDEIALRVLDYEKLITSAASVTDRLKIDVTPEEEASLKEALRVLSGFESLVLAKFMEERGYSACDSRHSDSFKEIHFWFKDGFVMASIRSG